MATPLVPRDVRQALRLLKSNPASEHTINELAASCQIAPRTLQEHFRQSLGASPKQVLRDIRLDLVRRELLVGRDDTEITELATRHGFNHLGRFSGWYRDRYGESPSATRRHRKNAISRSRASTSTLAFTFDRPIASVLPFRFEGAPVHQGADLAGEVAMALSRTRSVTIGPPRDARYHVRGKVRTNEAGRLRITVTLLDAASGRCLWADNWTGERDETFAFEEQAAHRLATKLRAVIGGVEIERAWRKEPEQLKSWDLTMRALSRAVVVATPFLAEGLDLASKAIEMAPLDPLPLAVAAWCHTLLGARRGALGGRACAERAAQSPIRDPNAEALLAGAYTMMHDLDAADVHIDRALALDGGCAWAWLRRSIVGTFRGRTADAIECLQIAAGLDLPDFLRANLSTAYAGAYFEAGRYAESARWSKRALVENPAAAWVNQVLAPTYALLGRKDEARAAFRTLRGAIPGWAFNRPIWPMPNTDAFMDQVSKGFESIGVRSGS